MSGDLGVSMTERIVRRLADVTVGTVIVLVHLAIADRERQRTTGSGPRREEAAIGANTR